ncbi:MAG TPA: heterodisulfide reductase-related iron-sulfur binding cluster [Steroidobacteraceae bacterium]|nr:heterodisulfide reductase-related iron-sulfur binding cluster [Steroidobacteraceae bacterium]
MQTRFTARQLQDAGTAECEQILRRCVHCGFCTATCPTYVLLGDELDSPRGRIQLIQDMLEQDRPATAAVVQHLDRCLSCLGCMTACPSGVHYQHLIDHARVHVERTYRRPLGQRLARAWLAAVLPHPPRLRRALRAGMLLRALARRSPVALRSAAARRWPVLHAMLAMLPPRLARSRGGSATRGLQAGPSAGEQAADVPAAPPPQGARLPAPAAARRRRVALLTGCAQSVLAPQVHAATLRLLQRAGMEVLPVEGCCGALVHHLGRAARAEDFAAALIRRLQVLRSTQGLDAVVTDAAGCGTQLKDLGYLMRGHPQLARAAAEIAALARDATEVLAADGLAWAAPPLRVAYHSACSLQHGQRVDALPRALLHRAGFRVLTVPEGHLCCGSAGTYNLLQPAIAQSLRERKLANIAATGCEVVAAGNVGCMMQLSGAVPVVHTVELLDWASGGPVPAGLDALPSVGGTAGTTPARATASARAVDHP